MLWYKCVTFSCDKRIRLDVGITLLVRRADFGSIFPSLFPRSSYGTTQAHLPYPCRNCQWTVHHCWIPFFPLHLFNRLWKCLHRTPRTSQSCQSFHNRTSNLFSQAVNCVVFLLINQISTISLELVISPVAFVCNFTWLVIQLAESIHFIIFPVAFIIEKQNTFIHATVLVEELPLSMTHVLVLGTFISRALLEMLNYVLQLLLGRVISWLMMSFLLINLWDVMRVRCVSDLLVLVSRGTGGRLLLDIRGRGLTYWKGLLFCSWVAV